jgi:Tfp pilus assembly protein PilX
MMKHRRKDHGMAMIVLIVVLIVATLLGIWGLNSSRLGILRSGHKSAEAKLQLKAEEGLQKALMRIQEISGVGGATDTIGAKNTSAKNLAWIASSDSACPAASTNCLCVPADDAAPPKSGCQSPDCGDHFGTDTAWDTITENVVCNFLGTLVRETQVIVVRKADLPVSTTETDAIYLVNAIARDSQDRRQVVQGVIVIPFNPVTLVAQEPYVATTTKGSD